MTKELFCKNDLGHLVPTTSSARDAMDVIAVGSDVWVEVEVARNGPFHRKYWKLIEVVHRNLPDDMRARWPTERRLHWTIVAQTGRFHLELCPDGVEVIRDSTSFSDMDQVEFSRFYREAVDVIAHALTPRVIDDEVRARLEQGVLEYAE